VSGCGCDNTTLFCDRRSVSSAGAVPATVRKKRLVPLATCRTLKRWSDSNNAMSSPADFQARAYSSSNRSADSQMSAISGHACGNEPPNMRRIWCLCRREPARGQKLAAIHGDAFSATVLRLASPVSKSAPIILSMLKTSPITLVTRGAGPDMDQVTRVASPCARAVNSAML
jgi:hypothetical protein